MTDGKKGIKGQGEGEEIGGGTWDEENGRYEGDRREDDREKEEGGRRKDQREMSRGGKVEKDR